MSIHRSLRTGSGLSKHRNVLKRSERILRLIDDGRWVEGRNGALGLPKVKNIKAAPKKKAKEEAPADGAEAAAAPAAATPAAKAAAPAAKAAAPAAKPAAKK